MCVDQPAKHNGMLFHQDYVVFIGCATDCGKLPFLIKGSAVIRPNFWAVE